MTAARQAARSGVQALATVLALVAALAPPSRADPLVVSADTGLALSGFDPVAYFTDGEARLGQADLELTHDGAVWRFSNVGNRLAFKDHPEAYTPRFGGYDPVGIARDRSVAGNPVFWAIVGERLYLFYSSADRAAFLAEPGRMLESAQRNWPDVRRTIGR
jgi:hypothetical protein